MEAKLFEKMLDFSSEAVVSLDEVPAEDMKLVQEIFQREGTFSTAESEKPILATYGIGPCVSVVGYSKDLKRGFVTHYDSQTDKEFGKLDNQYWLPKSLGLVSYWGTKGAEDIIKYDIQIIQGQNNPELLDGLEKHIDNMNNWNSDKIQLEVVSRDVEDQFYGGKNIALDLRTGKSFSYNSLSNPDRRDLDQFTAMQLSFPSPLKWKIDKTLMDKQ